MTYLIPDLKLDSCPMEFQVVDGTVLSSEKQSETRVTSSGGGGYVGPNGGHVSAPVISSYTVSSHEFWLRLANGTEEPVRLPVGNIPLRTGQRVLVVTAMDKRDSDKQVVALYNVTANRWWQVTSNDHLVDRFEIYSTATHFTMGLGAIVAITILGNVTAWVTQKNELWGLVPLLATLYAIWRLLYRIGKFLGALMFHSGAGKKFSAHLAAHVPKLVDNL